MDINFIFHLVYCLPAETFLSPAKQSISLQQANITFSKQIRIGPPSGEVEFILLAVRIRFQSKAVHFACSEKTYFDAAAKHGHKKESAFCVYQVFSFLCKRAKNSVLRHSLFPFFHTRLTLPGITSSSL